MNDSIRIATVSDGELLLNWRNHPIVRQFSKSSGEINEVEHIRWLEIRLAKTQFEPFFIFISDERAAGTARLDKILESENCLQVSILIDPAFQGLGKSKTLLDLVCNYVIEKLGPCKIVAHVHHENTKSISLFQSAGFTYLSRDGNFLEFQKNLIN
jgi:RimJ/RimL family protein N-acetyltransferase